MSDVGFSLFVKTSGWFYKGQVREGGYLSDVTEQFRQKCGTPQFSELPLNAFSCWNFSSLSHSVTVGGSSDTQFAEWESDTKGLLQFEVHKMRSVQS